MINKEFLNQNNNSIANKKKVILSIGIIAVILAGTIFAFSRPTQSKLVKVPKIHGLALSEAKRVLADKGLHLFIKSEQPSDKPKQIVLWQKPIKGAKVDSKTVIEVGISSGPIISERRDNYDSFLKNSKQYKNRIHGLTSSVDVGTSPTGSNSTKPTPTLNSGKTYIVCIDPGHQRKGDPSLEPIGPGSPQKKPGVSGGATGTSSKTPEYEITLKIALKLKAALEARQIKVVMTRTTNDVNISNIKRAEIANNSKANLFVRIHADGNNNKSVNGISTLYPANSGWTAPIYPKSFLAAQIVHNKLIQSVGRLDRGIKSRSDLSGFNWSKVPAILAEVGFLSNPSEDLKLNTESEQQRIASGLAEGISSYLAK